MNEKTAADRTPTLVKDDGGFSIEDWLLDAQLPQSSADVYKAGHVPARAKALKREMEQFQVSENPERAAGEVDEYLLLEKEYIDLLQKWSDSRITVYVTALPPEKLQRLRDENAKSTEGMEPSASNELFGYALLSASIVGVAEPGKAYGDMPYGAVELAPRQIRALEKKIGPLQMKKILDARMEAQAALPEVDADFLLGNSGSARDTTAS